MNTELPKVNEAELTPTQLMLKSLLENFDHYELGRAMGLSKIKMFGLLDGTHEMKKHTEAEIRSHFQMKKRVKDFSTRMQKFQL